MELISLHDELAALVAALDAEAVPYALCGGFAVAIHGFPRATKDIDILARPEDLERVRRAAKSCGFSFEGQVWTVSRDGLITLKITAGRPQDLVDVQRLMEAERGQE